MVDYTVINTNHSVTGSLNVGAKTVPALDVRSGITLTAAELATVVGTAGVFVIKDGTTSLGKRWLARLLKYKKVRAVA